MSPEQRDAVLKAMSAASEAQQAIGNPSARAPSAAIGERSPGLEVLGQGGLVSFSGRWGSVGHHGPWGSVGHH